MARVSALLLAALCLMAGPLAAQTASPPVRGGVIGGRAEPPPQAPSPPPSPAPVRVGGAIRQPAKIKHVNPLYPADAQTARVQGVVILEATIGPDGKIQDAKVIRSIPLLDAAALDAVKQWEYTPTLLNGVPVPVIMTVTVNFALPVPGASPQVVRPPSGRMLITSQRRQDGRQYLWEIPTEQARALARWTPRMGPLPLSVDEAIKTGEEWLKKQMPEVMAFEFAGANLARIQPLVLAERWYYHLTYRPSAGGQRPAGGDAFVVIVLLDGSIIEPRVVEPAQPGL